jgi:CRISPR locus-related DNA-binding protein
MEKKGGGRVIISTIYEGYAVKQAITKLSPDKLILLVDEPFDVRNKEKMIQLIKSIKDFFKESLIIETAKIPSYDIPKIMEEVIKIIDKEYKEGNKIFIHTTEGRKTTSFALLFAAYRRKDKINGAHYITEEKHTLINLPLLNFDINDTKKFFLKEIANGNGKLRELQKKAKLKPSAAYQNIQELKKEGYLSNDREPKLTDLGRIMIL